MAEQILTIVFRGLIVVNPQNEADAANSYCEMGVHSTAPGHFLRINIVKNCVLETVQTIKPEEMAERDWQLSITSPVGSGISKEQQGAFNRKSHPVPEDFRWLVDLEDDSFYGDLTGKLKTSMLSPVIRVSNGRLYTRLKSRLVKLLKEDVVVDSDFGNISVAVGCDLRVQLANPGDTVAELKAGGKTIFEFTLDPAEPHTIYEIVNTPPDIVPAPPPLDALEGESHDHMMEAAATDDRSQQYHFISSDPNATRIRFEVERQPGQALAPPRHEVPTGDKAMTAHDHFLHYYTMFNPPVERFHFEEPGGGPGPRPALCGMALLGKRTTNL